MVKSGVDESGYKSVAEDIEWLRAKWWEEQGALLTDADIRRERHSPPARPAGAARASLASFRRH
jgi:hypothetical protein